MISRSTLSRLALGGAIFSAANAAGAIVVFDTNGAFVDGGANEGDGEKLAFDSIARNGTFNMQKWGYYDPGPFLPSLPTPSFSLVATNLIERNSSGFFGGTGYYVAFASGENDMALLSYGDEVSPYLPGIYSFQYVAALGIADISEVTVYLGLRITLDNNDTHYGWAQISRAGDSVLIPRFAFNDVANESILAGQTTAVPEASTLGLVGGLFGLVAAAHVRRRKAKQAAASDKFLSLAAGEKLN